MNVVEVESPS